MNICKTPKFYFQATEVKQLETSGMELDVTKADKAIDVKDKDVKDLASEEMTSKVSIFLYLIKSYRFATLFTVVFGTDTFYISWVFCALFGE